MQDPSLKLQVTHVTLEVERGVKGNGQGRLTFKMLGDQRAVPEKGLGIEGVPRFAVGEELVLFLYGESRSGLTSPVGFGQGKFSVVRDKEGRAVATNAFGNRHLFEGLPEDAKEKLQGRQERWKGEVGIPPEVLLDLVTRLAR